MPFGSPSVRASMLTGLAPYVESETGNFDQLLSRAGLARAQLEDPLSHVPLDAANRFLELAADEAQDEHFALRAAMAFNPGGSGLLGGLVLSSPTARDAIRVMAAHVPTFITGLEAGFAEHNGLGYAHWRLPDTIPPPRRQLALFIGAVVILRLRLALGEGWRPLSAQFEHRAMPGEQRGDGPMADVFGERVKYECERNLLVMELAVLSVPMPTSDPVMHAVLSDLARRWMTDLDVEISLTEQVRNEITARLSRGSADLERVAMSLGLTQRVLQRRLDVKGTSFDAILNEVRSSIALRLLQETDRPLMQIAYDLGYSDPSAFTRAARRWFEISPSEVRRRARSNGP